MVVNSWWSTACPNSWFYLLPSIILTKRFIFTKQARKPQSCWKLCVDTDALTDYRRQSPSLSFLLHLNSQFPSYLVVFLRLMLNRNETRWKTKKRKEEVWISATEVLSHTGKSETSVEVWTPLIHFKMTKATKVAAGYIVDHHPKSWDIIIFCHKNKNNHFCRENAQSQHFCRENLWLRAYR